MEISQLRNNRASRVYIGLFHTENNSLLMVISKYAYLETRLCFRTTACEGKLHNPRDV